MLTVVVVLLFYVLIFFIMNQSESSVRMRCEAHIHTLTTYVSIDALGV